MKDNDLNTFVDRRAMSVNENYTTARERLVSSQTDESKAESRIDDVALYLEAVGVEKKRKHSAEEFTASRARVDDQQRQIAELREHVMRLSGQSCAGTSSSDPAPATDPNVSTSQQQPLISPDLDAANDTLVTPPSTTAHPTGTPPGDSTLDREDEQPRSYLQGSQMDLPLVYLLIILADTDPLPPTTYGAQGNKDHNDGNPLALPSGPITRSREKKYGATMSLYIQEQITQELHDLAFNKCYEELEGTPKFLTLIEAQVEWEPCLDSTPVQSGTPQAVHSSASQGTTLDLMHARAN
ncbi:hypothetical protein JCGZ_13590 [Jatropha curcas]|uniref:Uncharacterized protein n=1 Tax=Jatropha curcas TaxID=180498 RepID=A0A067KLL4_JATCU|nr:hypothetical protein JCGZ_13590 [Jatropha curcas]